MNKFIKINTASGGPFLINANDIAYVADQGGSVRINTSNQRYYEVFKPDVISGTHSSPLFTASGTTTSSNEPNWPPKLIDSNAQFTSNNLLLPGDAIYIGFPLSFNQETYNQASNFVLSDTELELSNSNVASGQPYSIASGSIISDNSADFIAAGVQVGQAMTLSNPQWGTSEALVSAVTATTITLADRYNSAVPYGQLSIARPNPYPWDPSATTYTITNSADIEIQKAINATIGDVLNNTYSHIVEVPIVVSKVSQSNY